MAAPDKCKWVASQYLDDGRWGVLSEENDIIVRLRENKTEAECRKIAEEHNASLRMQEF